MLKRLIDWLSRIDAWLSAERLAERLAAKDRRRQLREQAGPLRQRLRAARMALDGQPLIYTARGNIPVSDLQYFIQWTESPQEIRLREVYMLQDGETIVKDSSHVKQRNGMQIGAVAQPLV